MSSDMGSVPDLITI